MLKCIYYELIAQYYLFRLKLQYDGFTLRFFRNLFSLHSIMPSFLKRVNINDYLPWDFLRVEQMLREELGWDTPRRTQVPYFRFDCHYSAFIDKSFKRVTGFSEHALLCNWFAQAGIVSRETIKEDFEYMNNEDRINKEIERVKEEFEMKDLRI